MAALVATSNRHHVAPMKFVGGFLVVYLIVVLVGISRHELWRDEIQAWMVAEHSPSIYSLFVNNAYDGHPVLWYVALWVITRFTAQPFFMQLFHALVATTTVALMLGYFPLPRYQRVLVVFGYYPLYEFGVISRNYALGVLLTTAFCVMRGASRQRLVWQVVVLVLLMHTSAYGLLVATALLIYPASDLLRETPGGFKLTPSALLCAALALAGIFLSVADLRPPSDAGFKGLHLNVALWSIGETMTVLWRAFVPLPRPGLHFWNTNIVTSEWVQVLLSVGILLATIGCLRKSLRSLGVYLIGIAMIMGLSHVREIGFARHYGHLFILFLACLWLSRYESPDRKDLAPNGGWFGIRWLPDNVQSLALTLLLSVSVVAGAYASWMDWVYPFSAGKQVAQFLKSSGLGDAQVAGFRDAPLSTVAGYLDRPVYYLAGNRYGTFAIFDKKMLRRPPLGELIATASRLPVEAGRPRVLILNQLYPSIETTYHLERLAEFTESIEPLETYYVYLVLGNPNNAAGPDSTQRSRRSF